MDAHAPTHSASPPPEQPANIEDDKSKKKKKEKEEAKRILMLGKKLDQGVETLEKMEKKGFKEFASSEPTANVLFIYFGVGHEQDCKDLESFLESMDYEEKLFDMYPGFPHGFLEFASVESAKKFMSKLTPFQKGEITCGYREIEFKSKPKTAFFFYSKLKKADINCSHGNDLPNATASCPIPGIILIEDFITPEEEKAIFAAVDDRPWHKLATRRVQHDGYEFLYGQNSVNPNKKLGPLPDWIRPVQQRLESYTDKVNGEGVGLDQLTINDYNPGDGIPPHVDAIQPFEEAFAAVSMGSGSVMNFRHPTDGRQYNVYFPPRSAVIFTGEGRLLWLHSIACRKLDRINGKLVDLMN